MISRVDRSATVRTFRIAELRQSVLQLDRDRSWQVS